MDLEEQAVTPGGDGGAHEGRYEFRIATTGSRSAARPLERVRSVEDDRHVTRSAHALK
jgi:hypothetical protein